MVVQKGGTDYRYGYQGTFAEKDPETDWNAFELRMYDSRIARWLTMDPAGEFWSPYMSMGNNPVTTTDPDGGCTGPDCPDAVVKNGNTYYQNGNQYETYEGAQLDVTVTSNFYDNPRNKMTYWGAWVFGQYQNGFSVDQMETFLQSQNLSPHQWDLFYRTSTADYLKYKQIRREQWDAEGKFAEVFYSQVVGVGIGGVISEAVMGYRAIRAASIANKTRAFWGGSGSEANAIAEGFQTLSQTRAGQNLVNLIKSKNIPWKEAREMWGRLSTVYAKGASGEVHVFQNATEGVNLASVWAKYEYPALLNNPNVTQIIFHY